MGKYRDFAMKLNQMLSSQLMCNQLRRMQRNVYTEMPWHNFQKSLRSEFRSWKILLNFICAGN